MSKHTKGHINKTSETNINNFLSKEQKKYSNLSNIFIYKIYVFMENIYSEIFAHQVNLKCIF